MMLLVWTLTPILSEVSIVPTFPLKAMWIQKGDQEPGHTSKIGWEFNSEGTYDVVASIPRTKKKS